MGHRDRLADLPNPQLTGPRPHTQAHSTTRLRHHHSERRCVAVPHQPDPHHSNQLTPASRPARASGSVPSTTATTVAPQRTTLPAPEPKQVRNQGMTRSLLLANLASGGEAGREARERPVSAQTETVISRSELAVTAREQVAPSVSQRMAYGFRSRSRRRATRRRPGFGGGIAKPAKRGEPEHHQPLARRPASNA